MTRILVTVLLFLMSVLVCVACSKGTSVLQNAPQAQLRQLNLTGQGVAAGVVASVDTTGGGNDLIIGMETVASELYPNLNGTRVDINFTDQDKITNVRVRRPGEYGMVYKDTIAIDVVVAAAKIAWCFGREKPHTELCGEQKSFGVLLQELDTQIGIYISKHPIPQSPLPSVIANPRVALRRPPPWAPFDL